MKLKRKIYLLFFFIIVIVVLFAGCIVYVDPFFHYHAPMDGVYYTLDNERSQNDGIIKHFDYDAVITGTSLTENFKTSEFDDYFETNSVKIPFSGATFFETASAIETSFDTGHNPKIVLRSMDLNHLTDDKDWTRTDLGSYPDYLYNDSVLDDYNYFLNKDVLIYSITAISRGIKLGSGITDFDDYSSWRDEDSSVSGADIVLEGIESMDSPDEIFTLSDEEKESLNENVNQNIIKLANDYPETEFIYFIAPYSAAWWGENYSSGEIGKIMEAEEIAIKKMMECGNISIYCFTNMTEITENLDKYVDPIHYVASINSVILNSIADDKYKLSSENYQKYLNEQKEIYMNYDYNSLY